MTGPESSGTTMLSRMLRQAGAEVAHRSATWGEEYRDFKAIAHECDATIIIFRDPICTMSSQAWARDPYGKLQDGYDEIFEALWGYEKPRYVITYEQLVLNPASLNPILEHLGLDPDLVEEEVRNENAKYWKEASR